MKKIEIVFIFILIHNIRLRPFNSIMNSSIDNQILIPSVFLPRVSAYHDESYIENIFWTVFQTEESPIDHIDLVMKEDAKKPNVLYYIAFVFFRPMPTNGIMSQFATEIHEGKQVTILHSNPWYWKVSKNISKKKTRTQARILSEADEAEVKAAQKLLFKSTESPLGEE